LTLIGWLNVCRSRNSGRLTVSGARYLQDSIVSLSTGLLSAKHRWWSNLFAFMEGC